MRYAADRPREACAWTCEPYFLRIYGRRSPRAGGSCRRPCFRTQSSERVKRGGVMNAVLRATIAALMLLPSAAFAADPAVPQFKVDPYWPKPLPHNWIIGEIAGVMADSQ